MEESFNHLADTFDLERYLLECRRHEKNYILRQNLSYLHLHDSFSDSLISRVNDLLQDNLGQALVEQLQQLQKSFFEYKKLFNELTAQPLVKEQQQSGFHNRLEQEVQKARQCHVLITNIRLNTTDQFARANSISNLINIASILIGILLAVVLGGLISDRIIQYVEGTSFYSQLK